MAPAVQGVVDGEDVYEEVTDAGEAGYRVVASPDVRRLARELEVDLLAVARQELARDGDGEPRGSGFFRVNQEDVRRWVRDVEDVTGSHETDETGEGRVRTLATPATRSVAAELGVVLDEVPAVDEVRSDGVVTADAVRSYAEQDGSGEGVEGGATREPYRGIRRSIGEQMERSAYTAPHVTHHDVADVTRLVEVRESLRDEVDNLTYTPFLMKACVEALEEYPLLNSELDEGNEEIVKKDYYNIGVATATDRGLLVPVVDDVDGKGVAELADEVGTLAGRARSGEIELAEMQGGTFTITNVGVIGGEYATPIINYPEVGILAVGAIKERPRVVDGEVVPRYTAPLSLSFDHRVVDGAYAAEFTNAIIERLEDPYPMLLDD